MAESKDTIYIDIDDEITGIIDKLRSSDGKVVALVLPKRAAVFQSIVNMKLLKRAADDSKKNVVLITSEAGLMPLAGAAGVHVAKTVNSKPEIPMGPDDNEDEEETVDEDGNLSDTNKAVAAGAVGVGALAAAAAAKEDEVETLQLSDDELPENLDTPGADSKKYAPAAAAGKKVSKPKKDSKLKVPDFDRFKLFLIIGIAALIGLIIFLFLAIKVWPKAVISIKTDATTIDTNLSLNLSTTATDVNTEDGTLPAKQVSQQKTYTQTVATTGQKNNGNKASGSVTLTNCSDNDLTLPAGSGMSSGGNTFITQTTVTVPHSDFTSPSSGSKCKNNGKATVNVTAQSAGTASNGATSFTVSSSSALTGIGSTSGGTDNIVKVVNQNDINNAKAKIDLNDKSIKSDLEDQLKKDDYFPISSTFSSGTPTTSSSNAVGQVADNVTVTETVTYTMFGVKEDDLNTLVDNEIKGQIDTEKQTVIDNGINDATFTVNSQSATGAQVTMEGKAYAGPDLDTEQIKQEALGKKPAAVRAAFRNNPDITDVDVSLTPFWVSSVPTNEKKVVVKIVKPSSKTSAANATSP